MTDKEKVREELKKLIEKYHEQKSEIANEEQVCQSLILPLFSKVLGWDTADASQFRAQDNQKTGKRTDYTVRLNGISQFVVEVKGLQHEIRQIYEDYRQAIEYAKYKEIRFALLTNFRQFIILRADTEDQPLQCEVRVISMEKAADNEADFDILWNFNKEIWVSEKGEGLQKFLRAGKKSVPVSKDLVEEMRKWRLALLNSLAKHPRINELDFSKERSYIEQEVQRFIDRLIFICYCEDKELRDKELRNILKVKEMKYSGRDEWLVGQVKELFKDYHAKYDSDLFFEQGYCDKFRFEDSVLAEIIRDLREPVRKLSYDFARIDADVLGKAYENFIGHVITGEKRFSEKESISKRKDEGAYYTPQYIVNYIVDNTLRQYIKENDISSFDGLLKIKVLDPACGSGSFLIRAFEVLEEEARNILNRELTYDEKIQLALNCIFGVDLDERAVDIAKLRLSLALAAREKLPMLNRNIQCGNSLIDDYAIAHEKAFNWQERFKDIMQNGGFDVVVGNPPYVEHKKLKDFSDAFKKSYTIYSGTADLYVYFYERALSILNRGGILGFITSNKFMRTSYGAGLRALLSRKKIAEITDFTNVPVFEALVSSVIIILHNKPSENNRIKVTFVDKSLKTLEELPKFRADKGVLFPEDKLGMEIWKLENEQVLKIKEKIDKNGTAIKDIDGMNVYRGVTTGFNPAFVINKVQADEFIRADNKNKQVIKPLLQGRNIKRWAYVHGNEFLLFIPWHFPLHTDTSISGASKTAETKFKEEFPLLYKHLSLFKQQLMHRNSDETGIGYEWYALQRCANTYYNEFEKEKIIWGLTADKWAFAYDNEGHYLPSNGYILTSAQIPLKFILGLLNSNLLKFYFGIIGIMTAGGAYTLKHETISELPICLTDKEKQGKLINLVDKMLSLHNRLNELGDKHTVERERIEEDIKKTNAEIDELVYQLYGITDEEKRIIEESLR